MNTSVRAGVGLLALLTISGAPQTVGDTTVAAVHADEGPATSGVAAEDGNPSQTVTGAPDPTDVRVPAVGIDAPVDAAGLDADGALAVPEGTARAGWWEGGTRPGDAGPAVLVGHVGVREGPAVFADLARVQPGDRVEIARDDGSSVWFEVTRVQQVAKASFPFGDVYGPTAGAELRLVTCAGAIDPSTGSYLDNLIVHAVAVPG